MDVTKAAKIADALIKAYADRDRLTAEECSKAGAGEYCGAIRDVLADGEVSGFEGQYLSSLGAPQEFIRALAGPDGKRAKEARESWLIKTGILSHDDSVVEHAVDVLKNKDEATIAEALKKLEQRLESDDLDDRVYAAVALARMGPLAKDAAPQLISMISQCPTSEEGDRALAIAFKAIESVGADDAANVIAANKVLSDRERSETVRSAAASFLGKMGPKAKDAMVPLLFTAIQDSTGNDLYKAIASALGEIDLQGTLAAIKGLVVEGSDGATICCASSLFKFFSASAKKTVFPDIMALLGDPNAQVRAFAAQTIGKMTYNNEDGALDATMLRSAAKELIRLLSDPDKDARRYAAETLGDMPKYAKAAVGPLTKMIKAETDEALQCSAAYNLGMIGGAASQKVAVVAALKSCSHDDVEDIVGDDFSSLLPALRNLDPVVRAEAIEHLDEFDCDVAKQIVPLLKQVARNDRDEDVRDHAEDALDAFACCGKEDEECY